MKGFIRFSIFCAVIIWLAFFGGWKKLCSSVGQLQLAGTNSGNKSVQAQGVVDAFHRNDDLSKQIKKDGSDSE